MAKPNFRMLWDAFPDHINYPTLKDLYTSLGGTAEKNINVPGFGPNGNTCASRLSVAFNNGGSPIQQDISDAVGATTLGTENNSRIIFRVADLRKYLIKTLGAPSIDDVSPFDDTFKKKKGIVAFSVNWTGATGHIALWDGASYREPSYDNYSTYINSHEPSIKTSRGEFWELA
ncbi:T6SS effector amidase Tae4 family protein [Halioxenophilus aromaticivorans]|uniref:Cytoplasmic protein n=1 Tax=Halioxenophilus aromaticivorans TaxID=1306992 RepID=A0AAV3U274_9ALTE